jgi:hypothetical protein
VQARDREDVPKKTLLIIQNPSPLPLITRHRCGASGTGGNPLAKTGDLLTVSKSTPGCRSDLPDGLPMVRSRTALPTSAESIGVMCCYGSRPLGQHRNHVPSGGHVRTRGCQRAPGTLKALSTRTLSWV